MKSKPMSGVIALASTVLFSFSVAAAAQGASPTVGTGNTTRIAYVSNERIIREAVPAKAAEAKITAEFSRREKDLSDMAQRLKGMADRFERDSAGMPEPERSRRQRELAEGDRDFQRRQREFREDLNQRRNEELTAVIDRANRAIRQIAEASGYDLVVQDGVYVSSRIDITPQVLKALESGK